MTLDWLPMIRNSILLTMVIYFIFSLGLKTIDAPLIFDDSALIYQDSSIRSLSSWWSSLGTTLRPVAKLTFALENELYDPLPRHLRLLNLGLLLVLSFSIWSFILKILPQKKSFSWLGAILLFWWLSLPIGQDQWVLVSHRSVILSLLFFVGALHSFFDRSLRGVLIFGILAVLSRETVGLAVFYLLWRLLQNRGSSRWLVLVAFAAGCLALIGFPRWQELISFSQSQANFYDKIGEQWASAFYGFKEIFWASHVSIDPEYPRHLQLRSIHLLLWIFVFIFAFIKRNREPLSWWVVAVLLVLPQHSFILRLDSYSYKPFWMASVMLVFGVIAQRFRFWKPFIAIIFLALMVRNLHMTHERAPRYLSLTSIWKEATEGAVSKVRPWLNLGTLYTQNGDLTKAREAFERAQKIDPLNTEVLHKLEAVKSLETLEDQD
jgi:hypothetical protein